MDLDRIDADVNLLNTCSTEDGLTDSAACNEAYDELNGWLNYITKAKAKFQEVQSAVVEYAKLRDAHQKATENLTP
jgi:hypothetical protein